RTRRLELRHDRRVLGRYQLVPGSREAFPPGRGDLAFDARIRLDDDRHAPDRTMGAAALGVLAFGCGERLIAQHRFDGAVHTVVAVDAVQVPFDDIGDCVLLVGVQLPQARYGDVEKVTIDCGVRRRRGGG